MYNTDMLTQMKNRNAFDIDMGNLEAEKKLKNIGVGVIDLDYLKAVKLLLRTQFRRRVYQALRRSDKRRPSQGRVGIPYRRR